MALLNTFSGSFSVGFLGVLLAYAGKNLIDIAAEFYRNLFNKDPIRTMSFDILLACIFTPSVIPLIIGIKIWLLGWFLTLTGFILATLKFPPFGIINYLYFA